MILGFGATGLGRRNYQKSMKNRSPRRSAFWHRFLIDFRSFLGGFGEAKPIEKRSKKTSKKRPRKNDVKKAGVSPQKLISGRQGRFWNFAGDPPKRTFAVSSPFIEGRHSPTPQASYANSGMDILSFICELDLPENDEEKLYPGSISKEIKRNIQTFKK